MRVVKIEFLDKSLTFRVVWMIILPVDTSWALIRLLVAALAKSALVWCPTWLRLLNGRGLSTLRTPNGATEEVEDLVLVMIRWGVRSIDRDSNITVNCKEWKWQQLKTFRMDGKYVYNGCSRLNYAEKLWILKENLRDVAAENRCQVASNVLAEKDRVIRFCISS
mgnify:CR=1 FL=1